MEKRNNSKLAYIDCCMILLGDRAFESFNDDDLDSLYYVAYKRWQYHQTRASIINSLNEYRDKTKSTTKH